MRTPINIEGYRRLARRRLPRTIFDFIEGGADDEVTIAANRAAFSSVRLRHRLHTAAGTTATADDDVDLSTTLAGQRIAMPVLVSPLGNSGMLHPTGDEAAARAAEARDTIMVMSGASSHTPEEVARATNRKPWYQLAPWVGREFYGPLIDRVAAAGFQGLVVLVDSAHLANRERNIANGFSLPPRLTGRNIARFAAHPQWTLNVLRHRRVIVKLLEDEPEPTLLNFFGLAKQAAARPLSRPTWEDIEWIRERWSGPLGLKGVIDPEDARRAVETGLEIVWISNHGGRHLDSEQATLEALPEVVEAVDGRADVVLDGGIRRGTDIIKALCLGARAVAIGRAWAYPFAAVGERGITHALDILRRELMISLLLLGRTKVGELDRSFVVPAGVRWSHTSGPRADALAGTIGEP